MNAKRRRIPDRFFRMLLRLFPFDFRADHGREMEQVFRAQRADAAGSGGLARIWLETVQDVLATAPLQHVHVLRQDVGYAVRILRRAPGFTIAAVVTLAIGIGGATSVFTVVNAFLFRPLPVERPAELVSISALDSHLEMPHALSYPDLQDYRRGQTAVADLAGFEPAMVWVSYGERAERVLVDAVTDNYFSMLGVRPSAGRLILAGEARMTGDSPVFVLTYDYWQRRFAGDPAVVGRPVRVHGRALTVVGVAAAGFRGANPLVRISGFLPISMLDVVTHTEAGTVRMLEARGQEGLTVLGRLAPAVSLEQARAAMRVVTDRLADEYPSTNAGRTLLVVPETRARPHPSNAPVFHVIAAIFSALSGLLLLIASANIANILLARAAVRSREVALRSALGARRGRLVRQLLTESIVLAVLGGATAIPLAGFASRSMEAALQSGGLPVPVGVDFSLDWRVLAVCWAVSVAAGVGAGLAPAFYAFSADINALLKRGGGGVMRGRLPLQRTLIVGQIAVSLALLIFGALFAKTLTRARQTDLGFRTANVLVAHADLSSQGYDEAGRLSYFRRARERVAALPGVSHAAWSSGLPFGFSVGFAPLYVDGSPQQDERPPSAFMVTVDEGYLDAAAVSVLAGRGFDGRDSETSAPVALVNEALVRQLWPDQTPLGRRVRLSPQGPALEVVGMVANTKLLMLWEEPRPLLLRPIAQDAPGSGVIHIVSQLDPDRLADSVRRALQSVDASITPYDVQTMTRHLDGGNGFLLFRVGAVIAAAFGLLGVILASTGVYGVMACHVSQRTVEFGVRMAMGADRTLILRDVLTRGAWLAAIGISLGIAIAASIARLMRTVLLGVSPYDPAIYVALSVALAAVCLAASLIPARRATSVDPVEALRAG